GSRSVVTLAGDGRPGLGGIDALRLPVGYAPEDALEVEPVVRDRDLRCRAAQCRQLIAGRIDRKALRQPEAGAMLAQDANAEGVKRAQRDRACLRTDIRMDPLAHLLRGAVRERHGQDPRRRYAAAPDEVRD